MVEIDTTRAPDVLRVVCTGPPLTFTGLNSQRRRLVEAGMLTRATRILFDARALQDLGRRLPRGDAAAIRRGTRGDGGDAAGGSDADVLRTSWRPGTGWRTRAVTNDEGAMSSVSTCRNVQHMRRGAYTTRLARARLAGYTVVGWAAAGGCSWADPDGDARDTRYERARQFDRRTPRIAAHLQSPCFVLSWSPLRAKGRCSAPA